MIRRGFLKAAAMGLTGLAEMSGTKTKGQEGLAQDDKTEIGASFENGGGKGVGRPVRIVSIGFKVKGRLLPIEEMVRLVDEEGSRGNDIIVLPELCRGLSSASEEPLDGPTITAMSPLARKHKTYVACPIFRRDGVRGFNSVVLLDRAGKVVCVYDKVFPYWSEYNVHPPVSPGDATRVYDADFGRVGFATCFDVNFPEVWRRLSDQGAEVVIWPSAYSAGISLQAHAIDFHYYIVTCSSAPDCIVYDITGEQLFHQSAKPDGVNIARVSLDLDRCIFHVNFNIAKRDNLLREHPDDVEQEKWMGPEDWFVLRAKRPGVSARALAGQYGLEEVRHYIDRSRRAIDALRGWEFEERVVFPEKNIPG